ncbi:hypothetical protein, partial [Thiolapillus sp.]|uniref:hypothetical protein n=1 Tax=Thiolapillus sp. TaxID=2017437 RepID=UPI003AF40B4C
LLLSSLRGFLTSSVKKSAPYDRTLTVALALLPLVLLISFFSGKPLTHFSAVSETAVSALLKKMACKTCDLDPIPTSLLFDCSDEIVPALTHVVNQSLLSGTFPTVFKHAIVKPLLKKNLRLTQMI